MAPHKILTPAAVQDSLILAAAHKLLILAAAQPIRALAVAQAIRIHADLKSNAAVEITTPRAQGATKSSQT